MVKTIKKIKKHLSGKLKNKKSISKRNKSKKNIRGGIPIKKWLVSSLAALPLLQSNTNTNRENVINNSVSNNNIDGLNSKSTIPLMPYGKGPSSASSLAKGLTTYPTNSLNEKHSDYNDFRIPTLSESPSNPKFLATYNNSPSPKILGDIIDHFIGAPLSEKTSGILHNIKSEDNAEIIWEKTENGMYKPTIPRYGGAEKLINIINHGYGKKSPSSARPLLENLKQLNLRTGFFTNQRLLATFKKILDFLNNKDSHNNTVDNLKTKINRILLNENKSNVNVNNFVENLEVFLKTSLNKLNESKSDIENAIIILSSYDNSQKKECDKYFKEHGINPINSKKYNNLIQDKILGLE